MLYGVFFFAHRKALVHMTAMKSKCTDQQKPFGNIILHYDIISAMDWLVSNISID